MLTGTGPSVSEREGNYWHGSNPPKCGNHQVILDTVLLLDLSAEKVKTLRLLFLFGYSMTTCPHLGLFFCWPDA